MPMSIYHRRDGWAVRTDGGLGGYAWGLKRKKKLLELEKKS